MLDKPHDFWKSVKAFGPGQSFLLAAATSTLYALLGFQPVTYDHRRLRTRDPVRSPIDKQAIARLVLGWVTTGESLVLYVFGSFCYPTLGLVNDKCFIQLLSKILQ